MAYGLTRTSMALDGWTLLTLKDLAAKWHTSKAEVLRRAVRHLKEQVDREEAMPQPLQAFDWLQGGGGLTPGEAEIFREEVQAERTAKRYWWEEK